MCVCVHIGCAALTAQERVRAMDARAAAAAELPVPHVSATPPAMPSASPSEMPSGTPSELLTELPEVGEDAMYSCLYIARYV